ncbi:hypothetical protein LTR17_011919 [Elasticomyces elasticus]|nr:hypothetical protein LTR17_011919 [Elasticomyces elasticus]
MPTATDPRRALAIRVGLDEIDRHPETFDTREKQHAMLARLITTHQLKDKPKAQKGTVVELTVERYEEILHKAISSKPRKGAATKVWRDIWTKGSRLIDESYLRTIRELAPDPDEAIRPRDAEIEDENGEAEELEASQAETVQDHRTGDVPHTRVPRQEALANQEMDQEGSLGVEPPAHGHPRTRVIGVPHEGRSITGPNQPAFGREPNYRTASSPRVAQASGAATEGDGTKKPQKRVAPRTPPRSR